MGSSAPILGQFPIKGQIWEVPWAPSCSWPWILQGWEYLGEENLEGLAPSQAVGSDSGGTFPPGKGKFQQKNQREFCPISQELKRVLGIACWDLPRSQIPVQFG